MPENTFGDQNKLCSGAFACLRCVDREQAWPDGL